MRILTICEGGTVRSVSLARILKDEEVDGRTHDAVAASWRWNTKETLWMLCIWADLIVVMEDYMREHVSDVFHNKLKVCDVGPDRYGNWFNSELMAQCTAWAKAEGL